ncbi:MAG: hypothetical protein FJX60_04070 [Alphaproteobacteria bacterium]|nr:hypothetical protein [Alphaproteobacteria bacterium]
MTIYTRRFFTSFLFAFLTLAFAIVSLAPVWSASGESTTTMAGAVARPGAVVATSATQTLTSTHYDLTLGPVAGGQSWAGTTLTIYLSQGRFITAPSITVTDAGGAAIGVTVIPTGLVASNGSVGGSASYYLPSDLPAGSVLRFASFVVAGLSGATAGTEIRIIATAGGSANSFRQYATWQTLATVGSTPSSIMPESGWWWSDSESGRGYAIEVADGRLMFAAYMYRPDGTSVWYVANGAIIGSEFSAALTEYRGGGTLARWQAASLLGDVATIRITFTSSTTATLRWNGSDFGSDGVTTAIRRYSFTGGTSVVAPRLAGAPPTGWYWNAAETGTGWFLESQGNQIFLAVYLYDADGSARWYVAQGTASSAGGVFGSAAYIVLEADLFEYGGGQTLTSGARSGLSAEAKGEITVQFTSVAAMAILPGGRSIALTRFSGF